MQYITRNLPLTFQIKLSNAEINPYSGTYNFNVRNVQTNQQTVLTLVDISTLKNIYSKFTIDSGTTFGLFTGQNDVSIYDIVSGSTLIAKDRWVVTDTEIDNNIYFMQSDNNPVVYGIYTDAVPFTPIFTLTLLTSGVDVLIKLQQGSPNTESFDIWRKIGTGGTYINIGNDITSFVSYDNILNYNTEYFYKIRAKNTVGYSNFTAEQSINTANITGVTGSSYYTKSEINTYTGQTALLLNSKLNLNIFTGYTGTTLSLIGTKLNTSVYNTFINTTAPATYLGISATAVCATSAIDSKALCGCVPASFLLSGGTAVNSLKLGGQLPAYYLNTGTTITCAADSAKLNNQSASYYLNTGSTALCATTAGNALKLNNQSASYYLNTGSTIALSTCATTAGNALCLGGVLPAGYLNTNSAISVKTGTTYSVQASDCGKILEFTNTGATAISLITGLTTGFQAVIVNVGGGNKTICAGAGATLHSLSSKVIIAGAYNAGTVYYRSTNNWVIFGNLC